MGGKICWMPPGDLASLLRRHQRYWSTVASCLQAAVVILWQWGKPVTGWHQSRDYQTEEFIRDEDLYHWWIVWVCDYASHAFPLQTSCFKRQYIFFSLNHRIRGITIWNQMYLIWYGIFSELTYWEYSPRSKNWKGQTGGWGRPGRRNLSSGSDSR